MSTFGVKARRAPPSIGRRRRRFADRPVAPCGHFWPRNPSVFATPGWSGSGLFARCGGPDLGDRRERNELAVAALLIAGGLLAAT